MRDNECIADMLNMDGDSESILAARDRRVAEARKFNLLNMMTDSIFYMSMQRLMTDQRRQS